MKNNNDLLKKLKDAEKHPAFHLENAILHFTSALCEQMEVNGLNKAELARRLDKKPSYVTRVLSGSTNLTMKTMVSFAMALEVTFMPELKVEIAETYDIERFIAFSGAKYKYCNVTSLKDKFEISLEGEELYDEAS
jgi:transcriptional regulator with XRE-family HTH domain